MPSAIVFAFEHLKREPISQALALGFLLIGLMVAFYRVWSDEHRSRLAAEAANRRSLIVPGHYAPPGPTTWRHDVAAAGLLIVLSLPFLIFGPTFWRVYIAPRFESPPPFGGISQVGSFPWTRLKGATETGTGVWAKAWIKNPGTSSVSFDTWRVLVRTHGQQVVGETRTLPVDFTLIGSNGSEQCDNSDTLMERTVNGIERGHTVFGLVFAYFKDITPVDVTLDSVSLYVADGLGHSWLVTRTAISTSDGRVWRSPGVCHPVSRHGQ